jgi:predicted anti-sigma-YlaC factor YlaD
MRSRLLPSDECARACEWVSLRLDSQLSDFEEVLLEAHLERCLDCRACAESMTQLTEMLRATPLEKPTFAFQLPRRMRTRAYGLRAVSAVAAVATVATVGLSGLVSLRLSTSGLPSVAASADRALIGLKERQMDQLDGDAWKASRNVRPSLAEQVTVK